uniref:Retrotransposon gag domain-containing protein n=1 Tax=Nicotiana tabacum TaxID=4097 RepID=A0A1S3XCD6_TOBAC|nr:PREDICTED: uncharacterized protein LOC107763605 [Nicotiana tabacum]
MAENNARMKAIVGARANLMDSLNTAAEGDALHATPSTMINVENTPPPPSEDLIVPQEKEASTSTTKETPYEVKRLLEEWLTNALSGLAEKPSQNTRRAPAINHAAVEDEHEITQTNNVLFGAQTHDDTLTAILRKMEEMKNLNKSLRDQMREHQERVDKIPGAPKLLPKRDMGKFVEQPYTEGAAPYPIPKTFKMPPYLRVYDGTSDHEDHLVHYVTAVKGNDLSKEQVPSVLLKKFGETLTGGALIWYSQLLARGISTFKEMADKFVTAHAGAKKAEAQANDIFAIRKTSGEGLMEFLARFNRVIMNLPNVSEGMAVAAFQNGLSRDDSKATKKLLSHLMKYPPTTWEEIHNAYCAKERGHRTKDCIGLRQEVVRMLNQGFLKELLSDKGKLSFPRGREHPQGLPRPPSPTRTINMIIGDGNDSAINHVKFTTTYKLKQTIAHERYDDFEDSITFNKSDTDGLSFPHYDALVITLRIADTDVKRIMVDDGSGACIVYPRVLALMGLEDKIIPCCITLTGFNNAVERTSGEIKLPVLAGGVIMETTFHVMNLETAYNAIIGRLWIHAMRAVPSSFYQVIKFPTPWGVFSIRGEPRTAQEYYKIAQDHMRTRQLKGASAEAQQSALSGTKVHSTEDDIKEPDIVEANKATVEDLDLVS